MAFSVLVHLLVGCFVMGMSKYSSVLGISCTTDNGCRNTMSCKTSSGTVYCCPSGGGLQVNGSSGVCECNTLAPGLSCSNGASLGLGSSLLPQTPVTTSNCLQNTQCNSDSPKCIIGTSTYCCPNGYITATSSQGQMTSCTCKQGTSTGSSCTSTSLSSPLAASSSGVLFLVLTAVICQLN